MQPRDQGVDWQHNRQLGKKELPVGHPLALIAQKPTVDQPEAGQQQDCLFIERRQGRQTQKKRPTRLGDGNEEQRPQQQRRKIVNIAVLKKEHESAQRQEGQPVGVSKAQVQGQVTQRIGETDQRAVEHQRNNAHLKRPVVRYGDPVEGIANRILRHPGCESGPCVRRQERTHGLSSLGDEQARHIRPVGRAVKHVGKGRFWLLIEVGDEEERAQHEEGQEPNGTVNAGGTLSHGWHRSPGRLTKSKASSLHRFTVQ